MDNVQFLSGMPIPPGHRLAYSIGDAGSSGEIHVGATFLVNDRIVEYNATHTLSDLNLVNEVFYIYFNDCQLLNFGAIATGNVDPNNDRIFKSWIEKQLGGGSAIITGVLGMSYLSENSSFQWPYPQNTYPYCCEGFPIVEDLSDNGNEAIYTVDPNVILRLHQVYTIYNTSQVAGDRYIGLEITDGSDTVHEVYCTTAIPADSNLRITFFNGGVSGVVADTGAAWQASPEIFCFQNYEIKLIAFNHDPGDSWGAARLQANRRYVGY